MRRSLPLLAILLFGVTACSDQLTNPLEDAPTIQANLVGDQYEISGDPLCGGLSPCDAFRYNYDGLGGADGIDTDGDEVLDQIVVGGDTQNPFSLGIPGFCFLPPTVENHLSDPACSGEFVSGLQGFELVVRQVYYVDADNDGIPDGVDADLDGYVDPPSLTDPDDPNAEPYLDHMPLVENIDGEFYEASVKFRRTDIGNTYRLYVVRSGRAWAHRDVIVDPNLTTPADGFLKSIGTGNEPIKVRIQKDASCVYFDTQEEGTDNAATCLITGAAFFSFETPEVTTSFEFRDGNPPFLAEFEVSECLSLGFVSDGLGSGTGNALVDVPLADCIVSVSTEDFDELTVPATISFSLNDARWLSGGRNSSSFTTSLPGTTPFADARLNVLQTDEFGTAALPRNVAPSPNWFGLATSDIAMLRWLGTGLDRLAGLLLPEPLHAYPGAAFDFTRMSDFQVAVMALAQPDASMSGVSCASGLASCLDLGTFAGAAPVVPVTVHATAPSSGRAAAIGTPLDVPDARLHFFPASGTVTCPADPQPNGQICIPGSPGSPGSDPSTSPASSWDHLVVITGSTGRAVVNWEIADGDNFLNVAGCGIARPGDIEPNPPGEPGSDGVWGTLGDCDDRAVALADVSAFDNGPADGFTPFEPVDIENEVAIYGRPLTFEAKTCPSITVDGIKGESVGQSEWEACADKTSFAAPLKGPKGQDNAWLYTYDDGESLYIGLEVLNNELGNRIFVQLAEEYASDGVENVGDDILIIDFDAALQGGQSASDWHLTQSCIDNNANSLCGDPDQGPDGGSALVAKAQLGGAGSGRVFYEFKRPLSSPNNVATAPNGKEDLAAVSGQSLGLKLTVTQGQGGGKGGFTFPDVKTDGVEFFFFPLR